MKEIAKKLLVFFFCIMFVVSIGKDLTTGTFPKSVKSSAQQPKQSKAENTPEKEPPKERKNTENKRYETVQHRVTSGETVLSIIEKLNSNGPPVTIKQMIKDFEHLNPEIEPHHIQTNQVYTFPIYRQNDNRL